MLKIRTFLFALLGVSPLLFLSWQLPNQAKVLSTNNNESATLSGYPTPIAQNSPPSTFVDSPSKGGAGSLSGGAITGTGSNGTVFSVPQQVPTVPVSASSSVSDVSVTDGVVSITVTPAGTQAVNAAASRILTPAAGGDARGGQGVLTPTVAALAVGSPGAQAAEAQLTSNLSAAGVSQTLVTSLVQNLDGLFSSTNVSTTPSFPSAQLPQAQLVAGTKDLKASLTIAQTNTAPTVNINKLNNAINAYNQIILESSPVALQKLAQDKDFLAIGQILKTLRAALK